MIILKEISKRERALSLFGPVPKTRSEPARPTTERTGVRERDFKNNASSFYVDVFQSQVRSSPLVNSHFGVGTWHCHTSTRTRPTLTQTWNALLAKFSRWVFEVRETVVLWVLINWLIFFDDRLKVREILTVWTPRGASTTGRHRKKKKELFRDLRVFHEIHSKVKRSFQVNLPILYNQEIP